MSYTSNEVKDRYNRKTYDTFRFKVRKDNALTSVLHDYADKQQLTSLIMALLEAHFKERHSKD